MSWEKVKLGECIDVISGFAFKTKDFCNSGVPIIKIKNVNPPYVSLEDLTYIPVDLANKIPKYELLYDDILIAMTGSHINQWASVVGRVAKVKYRARSMLNQRVGKIILKENAKANLDYIYYFLTRDEVKIELAAKAGGAANQANISPTDIKNLEIPFPPLKTQNKIADILSAYDNLIENNQKQIKLLEEAAQRLYKQWFIDLRFPGHETTPIVDGLPEGWGKEKLVDFADVVMGQSPKSEFYNQEKKGLPFHQGVGSYGTRFVKDDIYSSSVTRIAEAGSILFSVRAPVGRLNFTKNKVIIGRGLAAINHKAKCQSFLFYMLKDRFFKDDILGNGAIFASISKDELLNQKFVIPSRELMSKFNTIASAIDDKISTADAQIQHLTQSRNRLLPKLMNGMMCF